ncbi:MAG: diaminopimelate epimerase [Alphaproteobacteria bacterium]|nr:diaminopimelate epimerase [Alphaproteobacteria bacterium]
MTPRFIKSHGLGNDYLVLDRGPAPTPAQVRRLCDRHRGPGADGVLVPTAGEGADHGLRIFNPDGGEAEKSGNGLRIFARFLVDHRGAPEAFSVATLGGLVRCRVGPEAVEVEMGQARFEPAALPMTRAVPELIEQPIEVCGERLVFTGVSVGNPHCVVFTEDRSLDALPWRAWGRALERHPDFPRRVNVQVARVAGPQALELRIWERGAGETSASGSSSCATAAAAVRTGRLSFGEVELFMPGGRLEVRVDPGFQLTLRGPVEEIAELRPSPRWWAVDDSSTDSQDG